jgi:DNA-binding ferritin-like protein
MPKTLRNKKTKRKTMKNIKNIKNNKKEYRASVIKNFLELINMVKLYHWKTKSYAQHQATDELHSKLNKHTDEFVEVLIGKHSNRIRMVSKKMDLIDSNTVKDFKANIYTYRDFLIDMNNYFDEKKDSDLLSIRDDILVDINQFLYLMMFDTRM